MIQLVIQSELVANEELPAGSRDPAVAARPSITRSWPRRRAADRRDRILLVHRTERAGCGVAAVMDHEVLEAPDDREMRTERYDDLGRVSVIASCPAGAKVRFVKYIAYGWSRVRSLPALEDQVAGALFVARHTGFDGLAGRPARYLDDFWDRADVEVDGDAQVQQAVRFSLWQVLQAGARTETAGHPGQGADRSGLRRPRLLGHRDVRAAGADLHPARGGRRRPGLAPARPAGRHRAGPPAGLEGRGLPVADDPRRGVLGVLAGQHGRLPYQRRRGRSGPAATCGRPGTTVSSGATGAGAAGGHGPAVDVARPRRPGTRVSASTASPGPTSTAPSPTTTSTPTSWPSGTWPAAADLADRFPERARGLGVDRPSASAWQQGRRRDGRPLRRATSACTRSPRASPATTGGTSTPPAADHYPLLLHFPYFDLYRKQVVKQPDLVMALFIRGDAFTPEEKARNFAYYEALTVRDSSLSACIQSIVAAEVGSARAGLRLSGRGRPDRPRRPRAQHPRRPAHRLPGRDLAGPGRRPRAGCATTARRRGRGQVRGGAAAVPMASGARGLGLAMAGSGTGLVEAAVTGSGAAVAGAGVAGGKGHAGLLTFAPRLPRRSPGWRSGSFTSVADLEVEITAAEATYTLRYGDPVELAHHGTPLSLRPGQPETRPIPAVSPGRRPPSRPAGCRPDGCRTRRRGWWRGRPGRRP